MPDTETMPDQTPEPLSDYHATTQRFASLLVEITTALGEPADTLFADLPRLVAEQRARIAELEAAQPVPAGYVVGQQHGGATLLQFEAVQVDPFGDRARAYATRGEAQAFADKCGPYDPRMEFKVYGLQELPNE
ncbi:hypothetical protein IRT45_35220 [Nocardia sp. BSTN01]|uniref:hypothetical protein n=1 Tax=Nocardia sp. BSTN01 TaxID=2783665 RepID=UPI001890A111|nr:hypothetical protein [Nocardia sp. BSTN01]MBF5002370.1 hypothetical protein [Nocardia sp. BSTN01]